jgi:protein gp37
VPLDYLEHLRDYDFNPWWGCTKVSPACDNCYAEVVAHMRGHKVWGKDADRKMMGADHWVEPQKWDKVAEKQGRRFNIFCSSMCDIMEARADLDPYREALWWTVERTPNLNWMFFTKRPDNYRTKLPAAWIKEPRENVWLITTVEHKDYLWRLDAVLKVPAVVHGVICEPLMSDIPLPKKFTKLGKRAWVISGGERGAGAASKITDISWLRGLRDTALSNDIPFFFNQWGEYAPTDTAGLIQVKLGHNHKDRRLLDGVIHNGVPESVYL